MRNKKADVFYSTNIACYERFASLVCAGMPEIIRVNYITQHKPLTAAVDTLQQICYQQANKQLVDVKSFCQLSTGLLQVDCQNLLSTGLLQVVSTSLQTMK